MLVATFFILSCFLSLKTHVAYGNARSIDHQIKRLEEEVWKKAHDLSLSAYKEPTLNLPDSIANLTYDQWRDIRFKPEQSLWRGSDSLLELRFYHLGFLSEAQGLSVHQNRLNIRHTLLPDISQHRKQRKQQGAIIEHPTYFHPQLTYTLWCFHIPQAFLDGLHV